MKDRQKEADVDKLLVEAGLPADLSQQLRSDMLHQVMRGSIFFLDVNSESSLDTARTAPKEVVLMLKGPERSWLFDFGKAGDEEVARISQVSRNTFLSRLAQFARC